MGRRFGSKNGMGTGSTRMSRHTGSGRYGSGGRKSSIHVPARPFWTTKKWKQKPLSSKIFDIVVMLAGLAIILVVTMFLVNGTKNGNNNENVTSVYSSNSKKKKEKQKKIKDNTNDTTDVDEPVNHNYSRKSNEPSNSPNDNDESNSSYNPRSNEGRINKLTARIAAINETSFFAENFIAVLSALAELTVVAFGFDMFIKIFSAFENRE